MKSLGKGTLNGQYNDFADGNSLSTITDDDLTQSPLDKTLLQDYVKSDLKRGWEDIPSLKRGWEDIPFQSKRAVEVVDQLWKSPKRGWEDIPSLGSTNPKRALEVVNRLWKSPKIREIYRQYLRNGKRSKEEFEEIPVQTDNTDPTWMIDEIGYYTDEYPPELEKNDGSDAKIESFPKRGWESIPFFHGNGRKRSQYSEDTDDKRAWEPIHWKRTVSDDESNRRISQSVNKILAALYNKQNDKNSNVDNNTTQSELIRSAYNSLMANVGTQDNIKWLKDLLETDV